MQYGYTIEYVRSLPESEFIMLLEAANVLQARDKLFQLNASDYPQLKKEPRKKLFKQISKVAFPRDESKIQSTSEVMNDLARMLNG